MKHAKRKCPAFGKEYFQCRKKNHFGKFCRSQTTSKKNKHVDDITEYQYNTESNYFSFEDYMIKCVGVQSYVMSEREHRSL